MSNLLSQASLVMIPSGYKEDVVYSQIPTDGSGDLSFTRASNGTRINSSGLVEVCPWNLLQYSEDFTNGYWTKLNTTITTNATTAPNGTTTADKVISSAVNDEHLVYYFESNILSQVVTMSAYVKKADYRYAILRSVVNGGYQISVFDLDNGIVTSQVLGASIIESVGNGWYRISTTFTAPAGIYGVQYGFSATQTFTYLGDGTSGNFLWGAQINIGSTAKPYFPTTDRLNVPRLTYQNGGGGCPSLLLEKQSTNLVTYSEDFDQWSPASVTVTANNTTSPDGTQNADLITATSGGVHDVYNTFNGTTTNTVSIFVKKGTSQYIYISTSYQATTGDSSTILVDLDNKTLINSSSGNVAFVSGSIVEMGNGWLRVIYTTTAASATGMYIFAGISSTYTFNLTLYGRQLSSTTQTAYFWGAQAEASSYATSLINTTSSSATRVADACSKTGISSLLNATQGTLFLDCERLGPSGTDPENLLFISDTSLSNFVNIIYDVTSARYKGQVRAGGVTSGSVTASQAYTGRFKIAIAYAANDFVLYINGVQQATDTSVTVPSVTFDSLGLGGFYDGTYGDIFKGLINECVISKTRLTNAELASLTTI